MAKRKSWQEKLQNPGDLPKLVNLAENPAARRQGKAPISHTLEQGAGRW